MSRPLTPVVILVASALTAALMALSVVLFVLRQPWLGLTLESTEAQTVTIAAVNPHGPSAALSVGSQVELFVGENGVGHFIEPADLLEEPDVSPDYEAMARFFERQSGLTSLLHEPAVGVTLDGGTPIMITPQPSRPLSDLPVAFWVQLFVGAASFLIGAWVWSLRSQDAASRILAAVGASTLTFSFAAAAYSTRELAIDGDAFRLLSALNHLGALGFGACMIALFLIYPRRLVSMRGLLVLPAIFIPWWLMDTMRLGFSGPATGSHLPTSVEMLGILLVITLQYWKTRNDPRARAALRWFALAVAVGAGAFVFLIIAPNLFGAAPVLSQGYAFLFFLLVFVGVALGVARYRLFELETWAFRILFYLGGVILLLIFDSLLIYVASLDRAPALSMSLVLIALLYLPLRSLLTKRIMSRKTSRESLFRNIMDVALAVTGEHQAARWQQLLQSEFDPLQIETGTDVNSAAIRDDGATLLLPPIGELHPLKLVHAHGGRKLFSVRDVELATELCAMLRHAIESRSAYEKGVAEERARIARDMHDNIGAQLLSALHSPAAERKDSKIRETLSDLRSIINNAPDQGMTMEQTLAELRYETADRLEAAGLTLDWQVTSQGDSQLSSSTVHALRSILREVVSNTIRHAQARSFIVKLARDNDGMTLDIADDGVGLPTNSPRAGNGLTNIRTRLASLNGTVKFSNTQPGLRLQIRLPLPSPA